MNHPPADRRIVLWRHGRTAWNVENRAQGQNNICLDEVGHAQARAAAPLVASFDPVALWSSDLRRATDTAAYLAELTGLAVRLDVRLREYAVGMREGFTFDEFQVAHPELHRRFFADPDFDVPGAEKMAEVRQRMAAVLRDIADALEPGDTAVVIGHGSAIASGILGFFDAPSHQRDLFAGMDNCAWAILHEHPARGWQLRGYNHDRVKSPAGENPDAPPPTA